VRGWLYGGFFTVQRQEGRGLVGCGGWQIGRTKPLASGVTCGEDYSLRGHMDGFYGSMV
jgi:hypothetical protein